MQFVSGASIRQVSGFISNVGEQPIDTEDAFAATLMLDNGALATLQGAITWIAGTTTAPRCGGRTVGFGSTWVPKNLSSGTRPFRTRPRASSSSRSRRALTCTQPCFSLRSMGRAARRLP